MSGALDACGLRRLAGPHPERLAGRTTLVLDAVSSTQDAARAYVAEHGAERSHGLLVLALRQTRGRGTRGRAWWSPAGCSLPLSLVLAPRVPLARPACLTPVAALAVVRAAPAAALRVRWPNDVVARDGAKVAGVLAESVGGTPATHVIGVGVNVFAPADPPPDHVTAPVAALATLGAVFADLGAFAEAWMDAFDAEWELLRAAGIEGLARRLDGLSALTGRDVTLGCGGRRARGRFQGIGPELQPILETGAGTVSWPAEHVELLELDGVALHPSGTGRPPAPP